jgi:ribokinase
VKLHVIGFGSLNLDEFWEAPHELIETLQFKPGAEYVRDIAWFAMVYPLLQSHATQRGLEPGGSAANMIAAMARMGFDTGFYGATGKTDAELLGLEQLGKPENLRVARLDAPAGRCLALVDREDRGRDRILVILPNTNDFAGSYVPEPEYFEQTEWLHLTSFVSPGPLAAQIRLVESLSYRVRVSFDPGSVYCDKGLDAIQPLLRRTEALFVTGEELGKLSGASSVRSGALKLHRIGIPIIVVKMGAAGISLSVEGALIFQSALEPRELKDRTGAGDVAAAGFIAGMIVSASWEECLFLAAAAASKSIEGYGRTEYPDRDFFQKKLMEIRSARHRAYE